MAVVPVQAMLLTSVFIFAYLGVAQGDTEIHQASKGGSETQDCAASVCFPAFSLRMFSKITLRLFHIQKENAACCFSK